MPVVVADKLVLALACKRVLVLVYKMAWELHCRMVLVVLVCKLA